MAKIMVDVVATSSVVPKVELQLGLDKLSELGFSTTIADNIMLQEFAYAGSAEQRATAFYRAAMSDSDLVWAIRGGYGAAQLLDILTQLSARGKPTKQKILIGYSDLTALYQFVSEQWGWKILHAPMLSSKDFRQITLENERQLLSLLADSCANLKWHNQLLKWIYTPYSSLPPITAQLYGGNLAVICSMLGTPWQLDFSDKILFLEEIGESWSKIDRMLEQLYHSGSLTNCKAIVLGEFTSCKDASPKGLSSEYNQALENIRKTLTAAQGMEEVFTRLGEKLNIPICSGLPVGHCLKNSPLPLLATYQLSIAKGLELMCWSSVR
ncbi:MAG: hypothetical protein OFPII_19990 [Osedax symbiont Rs1]|nr:MAG: hypothetical protein OFPII_19990 [Osedax symbiont Rs1]